MPLHTDPLLECSEDCVVHDSRLTALASEIDRELKLAPNRHPSPGLPEDDAQRRVSTFLLNHMGCLAEADLPYGDFLGGLFHDAQSPADRDAAAALQRIYRRYSSAVSKTPPRLGVCPAVVFKALTLIRREQVSVLEVEKIVECDPILTTSLLSFANSALFSRAAPVCSVAAAIAYIGIGTAKKVILAASARPMFSSIELRGLWQHSVDVAAIAEQIAASTNAVDPSEAFVAGLIHDIGRLSIEAASQDDFVITHRRLTHDSACATLADVVLTGLDHGQIGATLLTTWRMPADLIAAVQYHHRPELNPSPLSAILYLAECVAESSESVPSPARLQHAMKLAHIDSLATVQSDLRRLGMALAMVG